MNLLFGCRVGGKLCLGEYSHNPACRDREKQKEPTISQGGALRQAGSSDRGTISFRQYHTRPCSYRSRKGPFLKFFLENNKDLYSAADSVSLLSAFPNSGHSDGWIYVELSGCFRL